MTCGTLCQFASHLSGTNLVILWKYIDFGVLLATIGVFVGLSVWLSKGIQVWCQRQVEFLKLASKLPGPPALPLIGNALRFACKTEEILDRIVDVCKDYDSPFRFWMGPKFFVVLSNPRDFEVILGNSKASKKDSIYRFMKPFVGEGLVSGSGPMHRAHRKAIMPMLCGNVLDMYVEYFDIHSRYCVDLLEEKVDAGEFDIFPFMENCTTDIIFDTIMGTPGTAQQGGYKQFVYWTYKKYSLMYLRMIKVWLYPDWIFSCTDLGEQSKTAQQVVQGLIQSVVARKKKEHYALERGAVLSKRPREMLLEKLIAHVEKTELMDDVELRDEISTIYTAAQDTTAVISSFVLLMLGMHPEIQHKVRAEITEVLEDRIITPKDLSELKYLELVVKETLRFFPIAPLMVRQLTGDIDLETCTLPEGCSVVMVPHMTHRDPKYWTEPDKFLPERFLPENSEERHQYSYLPFSGGLRSCIGQKYAMMCLKTLIANVVRRYQMMASGSPDKLRLTTDISIRSIAGYKLSISRAPQE